MQSTLVVCVRERRNEAMARRESRGKREAKWLIHIRVRKHLKGEKSGEEERERERERREERKKEQRAMRKRDNDDFDNFFSKLISKA